MGPSPSSITRKIPQHPPVRCLMLEDDFTENLTLSVVDARPQSTSVSLTNATAAGYIRQDERYGPGAREVLDPLKVI